jgi:rhodanese-related sulfurtransferase
MSRVPEVEPQTLKRWLQAGEAVVVDVREAPHFAAQHLPGAHSRPLSTFDPDTLPKADGQRIVFQCEVGISSQTAGERALDQGILEVYNLRGGIQAWRQAGLPVEGSGKGPIPIVRQVHIVAGSFALVGTLLGAFVHPALLLIPGFVGAGLLFAGVTGICGMSALLSRLPFNRRPARA